MKVRIRGTVDFTVEFVATTPGNYLLDNYPGAALALGLKRLNSGYSGPLIRVRRSSDNTETDIGASGDNLDASSLLSFCGSGDGFVTHWYDQSGNTNNAIQSTSANQPRIVSSGSLLTDSNSLPIITFTPPQYMESFSGLGTYTNNLSIFIVARSNSLASNAGLFSIRANTNTADGVDWNSTSGLNIGQKGGVIAGYPYNSSPGSDAFNINYDYTVTSICQKSALITTPTNGTLYVQGASVGSDTLQINSVSNTGGYCISVRATGSNNDGNTTTASLCGGNSFNSIVVYPLSLGSSRSSIEAML
jgi:hypothetical protein